MGTDYWVSTLLWPTLYSCIYKQPHWAWCLHPCFNILHPARSQTPSTVCYEFNEIWLSHRPLQLPQLLPQITCNIILRSSYLSSRDRFKSWYEEKLQAEGWFTCYVRHEGKGCVFELLTQLQMGGPSYIYLVEWSTFIMEREARCNCWFAHPWLSQLGPKMGEIRKMDEIRKKSKTRSTSVGTSEYENFQKSTR